VKNAADSDGVCVDTVDTQSTRDEFCEPIVLPSPVDRDYDDGNVRGEDDSNLCGRIKDLLDIPIILLFGIILYVVDVGSDVMAAVDHFQEGHPVWGSLTITFVVLPALCWAAVSGTHWYTYQYDVTGQPLDERKLTRRRMRMLLTVLLLDPLTRYCLSAFV